MGQTFPGKGSRESLAAKDPALPARPTDRSQWAFHVPSPFRPPPSPFYLTISSVAQRLGSSWYGKGLPTPKVCSPSSRSITA